MHNFFTIIIPSYNVEKWTHKTINSALEQKYQNYEIIYIDDASTDNTYSVASNLLTNTKHKLIRNSFNRGKMWNVIKAVELSKDKSIIVILDGDDWLAHENVLNKLNDAYDESVWMTAGSYIETETNRIVSPRVDENYWNGNLRKKSWQTSHLGTFRKELFLKIKKKDFVDKQTSYFSATSDQAFMWPMLEMAHKEHFKCVMDVLYVYNRDNPLADDKVNRTEQLQTEMYIRNLTPYEKLKLL